MTHISLDDHLLVHRALADPMRILLVRLLLERELCVCEMMDALDAPQYKVSRHLSVLKKAGLVRDWREGTWMHYEIAPSLSPAWQTALRGLALAWDQAADVRTALARLHQRATRPPGASATCAPTSPAC